MIVDMVILKLKITLLNRRNESIRDTIKILAYSAKKIITNPTDPNSILKPETSSDSPSAKSKGVRLVSAIKAAPNSKKRGKKEKPTPL